MWQCSCICGRIIIARTASLVSEHTKSCGCYRLKHGLGNTKTYTSWMEMKRRCLDENNRSYAKYGGSGIKVCKRWMKFTNFLEDMGLRPDGKTLDRKNGRRGYSKSNCRWATAKEQIINRNITRWIEFGGRKRCLQDWANDIAISGFALAYRIDRLKWPLKYALTLKPNSRMKLMERIQ